jgi:phosphate transport system substrate-binding protein
MVEEEMMFKKSIVIGAALTMALAAGTVNAQSARDYISIVGSSTVYPFATVVAEQIGRGGKFKAPKIESTGTGGGFKLFCGGVGVEHPDISNASRAIKKSEFDTCAANGVKDIVEAKIGYDGIVFANSKKAAPIKISRKEMFLGLAKSIPNPKGGNDLIANPYKTWKEINPDLPNTKIEVLGPPPTSGTRDAFLELVMEPGADSLDSMKALKKTDEKQFKVVFSTIREDGAYVEAGENDNLIVQKLEANPAAFGIFGFSFLDQNTDKIQGSFVDGVQPKFETIADGSYPVSRPLFFYVKKAHMDVIPGMKEYLSEFMSEKAIGKEGYLAEKGLIPMPDAERNKATESVTALKTISLQ